jgi:hypothetical protein
MVVGTPWLKIDSTHFQNESSRQGQLQETARIEEHGAE